MEEIVNKVANSKLVTIDLEDYYPEGKRLLFDIEPWLFQGLILKEKDFRESVAAYDWSSMQDTYVSLSCSADAIIPSWAYLLIATKAAPFAKKNYCGRFNTARNVYLPRDHTTIRSFVGGQQTRNHQGVCEQTHSSNCLYPIDRKNNPCGEICHVWRSLLYRPAL